MTGSSIDISGHAVGAIYLCILNLPQSERYKRENMLLVGIIPGPHEPFKISTHI